MSKYSKSELSKIKQTFLANIKEDIPDFELKDKSESNLLKFIGKFMFWSPQFIGGVVTTIYPNIFVPNLEEWLKNDESNIITLAHEYTHLKDWHYLKWLFVLFYLSPQFLALFAGLSFMNPWFLLFLLFLLPIPSLGRTWLEFRAFQVSLVVYRRLTNRNYINDYETYRQFTTSKYYWMFPFKRKVLTCFKKTYTMDAEGKKMPKHIEEVLNKLEI